MYPSELLINISLTNINFKQFNISFIQTNHSIPDSYGIAIKTNYGYILHTGDFKFDFTPIAEHTEYSKITNYSEKGIALLQKEGESFCKANDLFDFYLREEKLGILKPVYEECLDIWKKEINRK